MCIRDRCSPDTGVPFGITQGRRLGPEPEPAPEPPVAVQAELSELSELEIEAVRFGAVTSCEEKQKRQAVTSCEDVFLWFYFLKMTPELSQDPLMHAAEI